jgi:putative membrane protein insertion efficiency factor
MSAQLVASAVSIARGGLRRLLVLPIRLYQWTLSPLLPLSCRFAPSCSEYAAEAILAHGAIAGGWLALRRLARCHPWGGHGYDPVPPCGHPSPTRAQ